MSVIKPENWEPAGKIELEDAAGQAVRLDHNCTITAGPGAGKTELLAQRACYLLQTNACHTPQRILAISFKNDAAANLKERVRARCGMELSSRFLSLTYDAFAKALLDRFILALPSSLAINPDYELVFENRLQDIGPIGHRRLNFKWINRLAVTILETNPKLLKALRLSYSHVFLDEFQDTTDIQYNLIKVCFYGSNSILTAVGDEKQRIMVWAGALSNAFERFTSDFNATRLELVMNHRSAPKLIALQMAMYKSLNANPTSIIPDKKWDADAGAATLLICENDNQEAEEIASDIARQITELKIPPREICLLYRQRPDIYALKIINALKLRGIKARVESIFQDLIKDPLSDLIVRFLHSSLDPSDTHERELLLAIFAEIKMINTDQSNPAYDRFIIDLQNKFAQTREWIRNPRSPKLASKFVHRLVENVIGLDRIKALFPIYKQSTYLTRQIDSLASAIQDEFDNGCPDWMSAIKSFLGVDSIPIMTIHKSKGLEFKSIYFIGIDDESFRNFTNNPEEDRCAFFVALSRAKENVTFTFSEKRNDMLRHHDAVNEFFQLLQSDSNVNIKDLRVKSASPQVDPSTNSATQ